METAYRLTWNPRRSENRYDIEWVKSEGNIARWRCGNAKIAPGSRIYLLRLGQEPKGIIGVGIAGKRFETYGDPAVEVKFELLREEPPYISLQNLEQPPFNEVAWANQNLSVRIPAEVLQKLEARLRNDGHLVTQSMPRKIGSEYRTAEESVTVSQPDPFVVDPEKVERGTRGHAITQNALASFLRVQGIDPRSHGQGEPEFDLAWENNETHYVAEVKSITTANEEKQLRLGLGQILRYRYVLQEVVQAPVIAVLVAEREPTDASWRALCRELGVVFAWLGDFEPILDPARRAPVPAGPDRQRRGRGGPSAATASRAPPPPG
jgi:hypothetical protein